MERFTSEAFPKAVGFEEASALRRMETEDIVKRLGVISADRVYVNNYPLGNPIALFNPAVVMDEEGEDFIVFARMILGYYKYVSAILMMRVPVEDVYSGSVNANYYSGVIAVYPSTKYDFWGTEDPRVYELDGKLYMTYTGRTINYFDVRVTRERTAPVTAERVGNYHKWRKIHVYVLPPELRKHVISDKDAFLAKMAGEVLLFHRPHMDDDRYYLVVSKLPPDAMRKVGGEEPREICVYGTVWVLPQAKFEMKVGWATPPVQLNDREIVAFVHGVDYILKAYRMFAMHIEYNPKEGIIVKAVTPVYIMEPRRLYEVIGDRPYTIFPCGLWRVDKDRVLITYGAGDFMVGFGEVDLNELMGLLDKGRIYE